nr:immunoglobulin heavy chain junction region [Macaca mulatta]
CARGGSNKDGLDSW